MIDDSIGDEPHGGSPVLGQSQALDTTGLGRINSPREQERSFQSQAQPRGCGFLLEIQLPLAMTLLISPTFLENGLAMR